MDWRTHPASFAVNISQLREGYLSIVQRRRPRPAPVDGAIIPEAAGSKDPMSTLLLASALCVGAAFAIRLMFALMGDTRPGRR